MLRRDLLKLAASGAALIAPAAARAQNAPAAPPVAPETKAPAIFAGRPALAEGPFPEGAALKAARAAAAAPFQPAAPPLPDVFSNLNFETYAGIRLKPENILWADDKLGFAIEPLHRGFLFASPMEIHVVDDGRSFRLPYNAANFKFAAGRPATDPGDIGFSGFRILAASDGGWSEAAVFQGASFFRARAPGQPMGVNARALAIKTADPRGEEFPLLRSVWIEKPSAGANALTIHALIDSESLSGAYRFTIRPGEATIIDVECTLIARVAVDHLGVAPMSAASFTTPLDRRRPEDVRPAAAEIGGLQMASGRDEWIWRPISNRATLQISSFVDENPKGFGFLQRDREFADYQDDMLVWQNRPSLWVEPINEFGPGQVALIEIPSESEVNSNCIAYWRPTGTLGAGKEISFAWRQFWCWRPPSRTPGLVAGQARSGRLNGKRRRFVVPFEGDILADEALSGALKASIWVGPGAITQLKTWLYRDKKLLRVVFDMDPGDAAAAELRLVIENAGKPVSETWLYRWTS